MYYRNKKTGTHYLTYEPISPTIAYVTTINTPTSFPVNSLNVEQSKTPFDDEFYGKRYPLTSPRNFGRFYYINGNWQMVDFDHKANLERDIIELESQVSYIADLETRQTCIDRLAALKCNLMELIHARTT